MQQTSKVTGKYLVGNDNTIPFIVEDTANGGLTAFRYDRNGLKIRQTSWLAKLIEPGKAMRVNDQEFNDALTEFTK